MTPKTTNKTPTKEEALPKKEKNLSTEPSKSKMIKKEALAKKPGLIYKGYPLSRFGNTLYYGDPKDKYVLRLTVLESNLMQGLEIATKVSVELLNSQNHNICKKKSEKNNLYNAFDIGQIWLKRALAEG